ncbi:MAG: hypothetical protein U0V49_06520 [Saprospiraceae bacterium]
MGASRAMVSTHQTGLSISRITGIMSMHAIRNSGVAISPTGMWTGLNTPDGLNNILAEWKFPLEKS